MNRVGYFCLNIAVALYLFANGIMGLNRNWRGGGDFETMIHAIFKRGDFSSALIVILSVCAIAAGIFLLLSIFRIEIPITDIILLVFIILWVIFIVIVDVIHPISNKVQFLPYLAGLATHLMVLGALITSTKRFGN